MRVIIFLFVLRVLVPLPTWMEATNEERGVILDSLVERYQAKQPDCKEVHVSVDECDKPITFLLECGKINL